MREVRENEPTAAADRADAVREWMAELRRAIERVHRSQRESDLQDALARILTAAGISSWREYPHNGGRLDFLVWHSHRLHILRIGIEVKVKGSLAALTRQVFDYLHESDLDGMLVVTTRQSHRDLPSELAGRPVVVHWLSYP